MQIALLSQRDIHGTDTMDALQRRAERLLGRIAHRIAGLDVSLADLNGPKGGVDRQCQIQARLHDGNLVVVKARSAGFGAAIDLAMQKLARKLVKQRQRVVETRRQSPSFARMAAAVG